MNLSQIRDCIKRLFEKVEALENSGFLTASSLGVQTEQEDDCWLSIRVADGIPTSAESSNGLIDPTSVSVTGGSGANGAGRIYTVTFPSAHPLGADFSQSFEVWDDNQQLDTGMFEIIQKTANSITYQINQGDDGGSEDDNDFYRHELKINGTNQTFVSAVTVNGNPI